MREPSLLPVFGKLGAKAPTAVVPAARLGVSERLRELFASHGGMVLKLSVVVWTVVVLGAVFFIARS